MHGRPNVPDLFGPPSQKSFRMAVADALRAIKREHGLTLVELADRLGCCDQTIRNALDEDGCLSAVTMLRIGYEFEGALEPVFALSRRAAVAPLTVADRVERIERELAAIVRECGE